jgi:sterol desaturase/sphingolipid hydroxylase (fatty acid hydroxylase superfamily)/Tol biopolymer transport system component
MDLLVTIRDSWLNTLEWVAGLAVAFGLLACLMPCNPGMYWWKDLRAVATNFVYLFVVPLLLRICRTVMLIAGVVILFHGKDPRFLPVKDLPLWPQCVAILLIQDVMLYWIHRAFHTRWAWKYHTIHHSTKVLDWLATIRFHPINNLLSFGFADITVLLLGFSPEALVMLVPFNIIYSAMVHANLNWTFGPLKYVFASPVFHRWHHTTLENGLNKNFSATFPFLDVIFGTFYMPPGKLPEQFGNGEEDFPEDFWGQFIHPFRKRNRNCAAEPAAQATGSLLALRAREGPASPSNQARWPLRSAQRWPIGASLKAASLVAVTILLGGGLYLTEQLAARNVQPPQEMELGKPQQPWERVASTSAVLCVALSSDGQRIVYGSDDGTVQVLGAAAGQGSFTLQGHTRPVSGVAISSDGTRIVSCSSDMTVKVWDAQTRRRARTFTGNTRAINCVAVSADGREVVSGSADGTIKVWDAATGREKQTLKGEPGAVTSVAISADGRTIVSASMSTATVWDTETGQVKCALQGHKDLVYAVAISPNGTRVVSGSFDQSVKLWDLSTGGEIRSLLGHKGPIYSVAISPDGDRIVSGAADGAVRLWDAASGQEKITLTGHADSVTSVAMSADGKRIVSGSRDGTIKVWDDENHTFRENTDLPQRN